MNEPPGARARYFRTGLSESENVVNEEEHVLSFLVTEIFGDGETGEGDTGTSAWGLVHLSGDDHLVVQIVTFTGPFSHSGEHGVTTMGLGDVVDQLHNEDRLADTSTSEQTDLASLGVGGEQVDDLDSGFEDLLGAAGVSELWWGGVDGCEVLGVDGTSLVNWLPNDIDDPSEGSWAYWHLDG